MKHIKVRWIVTTAVVLFACTSLPAVDVPQVMLIPGGEFVMGDHFNYTDPDHPTDEKPLHTVQISTFYMGKYDVTNQQYCDYLNSALAQGLIEVRNGLVYAVGGSDIYCETRSSTLYGIVYSGIVWSGSAFSVLTGRQNHPMVGVRWEGAVAYCNWLSTYKGYQTCYNLSTWACDFIKNGYRLPTEAEWEYAANGGDYYYMFPWGDDPNTGGMLSNWEGSGDPYETGDYPWTTPVGFYNGQLHLKADFNWPGSQTSYQTSDAVNGYGLYDMAGNVWQWTNDWYANSYYSVSPSSNPTGPTTGDLMPDGKPYRVLRGGNWYNGAQYYGMSRISNRDPGYYRGPQDPNHPYYHVGFRVSLHTASTGTSPTITGTTRAPSTPTAADVVWITTTVTDDSAVSSVRLTYSTGSGTATTTTVFTETMCTTAVKPWTGSGAMNAWTVTGTYCEQRTGSNYGAGNVCGMEYKSGGTLNPLTSAMIATTNSINAAGTSGYVEFWLQSLTLDGTDGWTFQLDSGSGFVTRLSELTGSSHGWQKYHYDLAAGELVSTLKMRFQFTGGGTGDDDRIDLDQITITVTTAGTTTSTVTMYDDGDHGDGAAGDGMYGAEIPAQAAGTTVTYYITATDDASNTSTDPATAPAEIYSYTVTSPVVTQTVGLFLHNEVNACPGYTLMAPMHYTKTYLINNEGRLVHTWSSAYEPGRTAYLLENGHLIRACMVMGGVSTGGGEGGRIEEYDWDGNMVWAFDYVSSTYTAHHDFKVLPSGNVIVIVAEKKTYAEVIAAGFNPSMLDPSIANQGYMLPDSVIEVQPTRPYGGTVVWQWKVWDHLIQDYDASKNNYGVVAAHPELVDVNGPGVKIPQFWNHMNSIGYNPDLDQIILSVRGNSELWVIDHQATTAQAASHTGGRYGKGGDLLYRWGNPQQYNLGTPASQMLWQQHDTEWISAGLPGVGHILIYNNGIGRNYSTIDEIVPPVDAAGNYSWTAGTAYGPSTLYWTYKAPIPADFYSAEISGAQRLPNGNTLICEGVKGNLFEVTSAGEMVWRYLCPVVGTGPLKQGDSIPVDPVRADQYMNAVFQVHRYPPDYAGLIGRDLMPGGTIELSATSVAADFDGDGDVDEDDLEIFESCASGPAIPYVTECAAMDLDGDGDADQTDFGLFQRCFSGAGVAASPTCAN